MTDDTTSRASVSHPADPVDAAVQRTLELAATWLAWDGRPRKAAGADRIYTPHKVIRRLTDHLVDHLAQIEALLAGVPPIPNGWNESRVTMAADLAAFTEPDLEEARQRLLRLAHVYRIRLTTAGAEEWDRPRGQEWTVRQIAEHVGSSWYAEQLGSLG